MHKPLMAAGVIAALLSMSLGAVSGITVRIINAILAPAGHGVWIPLLLVATLLVVTLPALVSDSRSDRRRSRPTVRPR